MNCVTVRGSKRMSSESPSEALTVQSPNNGPDKPEPER